MRWVGECAAMVAKRSMVWAVVGTAFVVGCGKPANHAGTEKQPNANQSDAAKSGETSKPDAKNQDQTKAGAKKSADAGTPASKSNVVQLPSDELVAGIPGDGPLTTAQIKAFLDDPKNHEVLEIRLPLGLAAGTSSITGLKENPLTRAKIELGRQLYFDKRISYDQTISCASCHAANEGWTRASQFGVGVGGKTGNRNSPVSYNRILSGAQFWDGRAASLEEQAKGPIANPIEMAFTHEECVDCIQKIEGYQMEFDKVFGALDIDAVAKAIASFERVVLTGASPFDYNDQFEKYKDVDLDELKEEPEAYKKYLQAKADVEAHPMSDSAKRGKVLFFNKAGCTACHVGPNLSDEKYHNIGVGMDAKEPDLGRFAVTKDEKDKGAFKTPTIRNVAQSAPYMHDGSQKTLLEVVQWYNKGGHPNPHLSDKIKKLNLSDQEIKDLVAFMEACTGPFPKVRSDRLPESK